MSKFWTKLQGFQHVSTALNCIRALSQCIFWVRLHSDQCSTTLHSYFIAVKSNIQSWVPNKQEIIKHTNIMWHPRDKGRSNGLVSHLFDFPQTDPEMGSRTCSHPRRANLNNTVPKRRNVKQQTSKEENFSLNHLISGRFDGISNLTLSLYSVFYILCLAESPTASCREIIT